MEFEITSDYCTQHYNCIIGGVFKYQRFSPIIKKIDKISEGYISSLLNNNKFTGDIGKILQLHYIPNFSIQNIILIGCGIEDELNETKYKTIISASINKLKNTNFTNTIYFLDELSIKQNNIYWKIRTAIKIIKEEIYIFDQLKNNKIEKSQLPQKIIFYISHDKKLMQAKQAIQHGIAIAESIKIAKDLGNMPPNLCNANYLSCQAQHLATKYDKVTTQIIDEQQIKTLGMNAYLAVGQGSNNTSLMSIVKYEGNPKSTSKPIVLIGKGLTFDSGGLSIKPANDMNEMKYDMCGAAAVYGTILMAIKLNLPLNIVGILACCENMISNNSLRPGDVLTTLSGKTIEVLNTDAEGRLVLCDVLTYVKRFNPEIVIDIATLTGACVIALGHNLTGLMSNNNILANELIIASKQSDDHVWRLPLREEFKKQLESNVADITNIGNKAGSAITAGCFLLYFACKYTWAHLDIAGTAYYSKEEKNKGATGRPIALLSQFLLNKSGFNNYI